MKVPLLDLQAQYASIRDEIDAAVARVFESQRFILGPEVEQCEKALAGYSGCKYGIGVSSGTDALLVSLMAEGVGPGDEVITSPYTFFSTAGSIARLGAVPVFADIDPVTFNLDPALIPEKITDRTKAIIPVHLYGQTADMDPIMGVARDRSLTVIEDAAQAVGAEYRGRRAGSLGHYGCLSFFPSKNLGGAGDGGMVVTNDGERAEKIQCLRVHGSKPRYYHKSVGGNFRLDTLQATVVSVKLSHLDDWTAARRANAERYGGLFTESGLVQKDIVTLPEQVTDRHIFNQYVVRIKRRDELRKFLKERDIGNEVYYPVPLHLQECFAHLGYSEGDFPKSEEAAEETLAIPVYPELTDGQAEYVVGSVAEFFRM
ncbi:MAG: DegT/DnrJ/EryC1/StrS family aminotransferase [Kiritimatiellia bacterium]